MTEQHETPEVPPAGPGRDTTHETTHETTRHSVQGATGVRVIGIIVAVIGLVFLVAGVATYVVVSETLSDEEITVSDDASHFAGDDVEGPFTAYAQADVIAKHAEEIGGGKTYAELAQDDPNRATVMNASFLRASLFTSVVAFGVAAFVAVMGVVLMLLGWALARLGRPRQVSVG